MALGTCTLGPSAVVLSLSARHRPKGKIMGTVFTPAQMVFSLESFYGFTALEAEQTLAIAKAVGVVSFRDHELGLITIDLQPQWYGGTFHDYYQYR